MIKFSFSKYKSDFKDTIRLAIPISLGQLGIMMMNIVDSAMVGNLSAQDLAASSVASSLFFLFFIFSLGVSVIITPYVAIAVGAKDTKDCKEIVRQSLYVNLLVGIVVSLLIIIMSEYIHLLGIQEVLVPKASSYLKILGSSILPVMIFQTFKQFIEGFGDMKPAMYITFIANIFNFIVNWLFIYGNWGFPELGLNGAGLATLISRITMAIMMILYFVKKTEYAQYHFRPFRFIYNKYLFQKILRDGLPVGFQHFFEVSSFSIAAILVGRIGVQELAAHQITLIVASITFMIVIGISSATSVRVGNGFGERNAKKISRAGFVGYFLALITMAIFGILISIFNETLPNFFVNDRWTVQIASQLLLIAALFQIFDGAQAVGLGILRGLTDVRIPTIISFGSYWFIGLASGYILAFVYNFSVYGIWYGFLLSLISSSFLFFFRFLRNLRKFRNQFQPSD